MTPLRQRMLEDLQIRRYSPTTIRIYLHCMAEFAEHFGNSSGSKLHLDQLRLAFLKPVWMATRPALLQLFNGKCA